ncbi:hypothetical protein ACLKA7_014697 [Drosophila subpalustris]
MSNPKVEETVVVTIADSKTTVSSSSEAKCLFTFDAHPYFSFPLEPFASSKYGSQVRERKIDRCLKQLQEALKLDNDDDDDDDENGTMGNDSN